MMIRFVFKRSCAIWVLAFIACHSTSAPSTFLPTLRLSWAVTIANRPDPAVVTDPAVYDALIQTGLPWMVAEKRSGVRLVLVPPGMGDTNTMSMGGIKQPIYIGAYEVTNAQFRQFDPLHHSSRIDKADANGDLQPVVDVSAIECIAFCREFGFRLPTEHEWEYACTVGKSMTYPWGHDPALACKYANCPDMTYAQEANDYVSVEGSEVFACEDGYGYATSNVGSFAPNELGLYDMVGNVYEWCNAGGYAGILPFGSGETWPVRGGGGCLPASDCNCTTPRFLNLAQSYNWVGLRVARSVSDD